MANQFEIIFSNTNETFVAELLEDEAPITCENLWDGLENPHHDQVQHGGETGSEFWSFVPPPEEELPYENSTVFPEHGDTLTPNWWKSSRRSSLFSMGEAFWKPRITPIFPSFFACRMSPVLLT